jgi:deoxyribonuclease V
MHIENLHDWNLNITQTIELQRTLASRIIRNGKIENPHYIAGVDVSVNYIHEATAAAVVLKYPELTIQETSVVQGKAEFPYVPGLLSFRELPLTLRACEQLSLEPDLVIVDGQGIAHPRRIGLASHLGLFLNIPTIGCAKSPLFGKYSAPEIRKGSYKDILDPKGEIIGAVLRTKTGVKPLFISIGHRIDLPSCIHWVLQCCRGYRLPEPTRLAHLASKGSLK